jgi:hypothetical protein
MAPARILIACEIFRDELEAVMPDNAAEVIWLAGGLHADAAGLARAIRAAGRQAEQRDGSVRLLIGSGCHPDMQGLACACGSSPALFRNCIEAFVGRQQCATGDVRTMMITPGWLKAWPGRGTSLGWDPAEMRMQHGRYDRILLLDPGLRPVPAEQVLALFDLIRVPIEVQPLDLAHFRKVVADALA